MAVLPSSSKGEVPQAALTMEGSLCNKKNIYSDVVFRIQHRDPPRKCLVHFNHLNLWQGGTRRDRATKQMEGWQTGKRIDSGQRSV